MTKIITKFFRANIRIAVGYTLICAAIIAVFFLTGIFSQEKTLKAGILASGFILLSDLIMLTQIIVIAPVKLRRQLSALTPTERDEIISGFEEGSEVGEVGKVQTIGGRYFLRCFAVIFSYRRIYVLKYSEIKAVERVRKDLFLTLANGKSVIVQPGFNEDLTPVIDALRKKNPGIIVLSNGE